MRTARNCIVAVMLALTAGWSQAQRAFDAPLISVPPPTTSSSFEGGAQETSDLMVFFNGDRLHGRLVAFSNAANGLKWIRDDVEKPMAFKSADVAFVKLGGRASRSREQGTATVIFGNRDSIGCSLVSIDGKSVVVETDGIGRMTINRSMVDSIIMNGAGSVVYDGANDPGEWTFSNADYPGNKVDGGVLNVSYGVAERRIQAYPEMMEVRFTASWNRYPSLAVLVLGETSGGSFVNGYSVSLNSSTVYIQKLNRNSGSRQLASINVEKFGRGGAGSAVVQIFIDQKKKSLSLAIDGEVVRTLVDTGGTPAGSSLAFSSSSGRNEPTRITGIKVANWDGRLPSGESDSASEVKEDTVRLKNGDKLTGKLEGVAGGKVSVTTSFAVLSIPLENAETIALSSVGREIPRRNRMDVRVRFSQSGVLTADLGSIEGDAIRCSSESYGNISISLDMVRSIDFNIYRERPAKSGDSGGRAFSGHLFD